LLGSPPGFGLGPSEPDAITRPAPQAGIPSCNQPVEQQRRAKIAVCRNACKLIEFSGFYAVARGPKFGFGAGSRAASIRETAAGKNELTSRQATAIALA